MLEIGFNDFCWENKLYAPNARALFGSPPAQLDCCLMRGKSSRLIWSKMNLCFVKEKYPRPASQI